MESVISNVPSSKNNRKQPPVSLVPARMNKNLDRDQIRFRTNMSNENNNLIKISDESRNNVSQRKNSWRSLNDKKNYETHSSAGPLEGGVYSDSRVPKEESKTHTCSTPKRASLLPPATGANWSPTRGVFR